MKFEPIGIIKSSVTETIDQEWGKVESEIHLNISLAAGLQGLDQFSHVIIIFFMHQTPTFSSTTDLVRRPMKEMPFHFKESIIFTLVNFSSKTMSLGVQISSTRANRSLKNLSTDSPGF